MKKYIGTDITEDAVTRLMQRFSSDKRLPKNITIKDIHQVYSIIANNEFTPKQIHSLLPHISLKKIRYCIHFMLRYDMIYAARGKHEI